MGAAVLWLACPGCWAGIMLTPVNGLLGRICCSDGDKSFLSPLPAPWARGHLSVHPMWVTGQETLTLLQWGGGEGGRGKPPLGLLGRGSCPLGVGALFVASLLMERPGEAQSASRVLGQHETASRGHCCSTELRVCRRSPPRQGVP